MDAFNYSTYDRQLQNLVVLTQALAEGWDDIMTVEMTIDLKSLCLKASRLCVMADTDFALQQQDLAHLRTQRNKECHEAFNKLMVEFVGPLMKRVVAIVRQSNKLEGHRSALYPCSMTSVLPHLREIFEEEKENNEFWNDITIHTAEVEELFRKNLPQTKFPGMDFRERLWMLFELFALLCYLLFHFRRVMRLCNCEISEENAGARLREVIVYYKQTPQGSSELDRYLQALRFDHCGELTLALIEEERRALRKSVPPALQLCYMNHWMNLDEMGSEIVGMNVEPKDYLALVDVLAKCQLLEQEAYKLTHPESVEPEIYNEVLVCIRYGKPVDLKQLRSHISSMVKLITRKNHWFCLWCVLWHKGYLADKNYGSFARQMMHDDWFGKTPAVLTFSADTLSEYAGYFTERYYTVWNTHEFLRYRDTHGKKKWGDSLCSSFLAKCYDMALEFDGN